MVRRKLGQLEAEILAVLAGEGRPVSVLELQRLLEGPPAPTTIHTVLTRLLQKQMVVREPHGKSFLYQLAVDESEVAAEKMFSPLRSAHDPKSVLSQFAQGLSPEELAVLRGVLEAHGEEER
jgi:predicted transcriptional regulator